jgi:hypothetical protein
MKRAPLLYLPIFIALGAPAQTPQVGADWVVSGSDQVRFEYVGYRPAEWESDKVREIDNERPNLGGWVTVYFTNTSEDPLQLAFYRLNGEDESTWRLGSFIAWDRLSSETLSPGETGFLEISGLTEDFAPGHPFHFSWVGRSRWMPVGKVETSLVEDPLQISLIRFLPDLKTAEIHIRYDGQGEVDIANAEILGREARTFEAVGGHLEGPDHAIVRLTYNEPLAHLENAIAKVVVEENGHRRNIFSHRRIFPDEFPIGTWGIEEGREAIYRQHHIDTCVQGSNPGANFFQGADEKFGLNAMVHTGVVPDIDGLRGLAAEDSVLCWMIQDEPDWSATPQRMVLAEEITRHYNNTKPTFITLCRNVKFFEYAQIPDIPCHDHYCVAAPSSSKWPERYGTHLEETAYYTRDLKRASEPKPVWVWSQGVHEWDGRIKMPLPTPEELTAQLWFNVGRGAKGIIWFTFDLEMGEKYPATRKAVQESGRILRLLREDLLGAEPLILPATSPEKVDVAILASWDKAIVFVINQDYDIDPHAYKWRPKEKVKISLQLPDWLEPQSFIELTGEGPRALAGEASSRGKVDLNLDHLEVNRVFVLDNAAGALDTYRAEYEEIVADESREW